MWDRHLKHQFLDLFRLARLQVAARQEAVSWNGDNSHWTLIFVISLNDSEGEGICGLLASLANKEVFGSGE